MAIRPPSLHGIINLNKPSGMTSHQAVARVKRLLRAPKAGHAGTLDPLATGVLLICLNEATKISRFLLDMGKTYEAVIRLGQRTDTYDAEGRVLWAKDIDGLAEQEIMDAVGAFRGSISQKPPMYSAVKVKGEKLYRLARKGIEIERPERTVEIHEIRVTEIRLPHVHISVSCSKGTYIRSLADDIGMKLGCGAHLAALSRSASGPFHINDSVTMDGLLGETDYLSGAASPEGPGDEGDQMRDAGTVSRGEDGLSRRSYFTPIDIALSALPEMILDDAGFRSARHGAPIVCREINAFPDGSFLRLKGPGGDLFGIGRSSGGSIFIERLLNL